MREGLPFYMAPPNQPAYTKGRASLVSWKSSRLRLLPGSKPVKAAPSLQSRYRTFPAVGSEEAPRRAGLRPPLKRLVQSSRKPLSRWCLREALGKVPVPLFAPSRAGHGPCARATVSSRLPTSKWPFPSPAGLIPRISLPGARGSGLSLKEPVRLMLRTHSFKLSRQPPSPTDCPGPPGRCFRSRTAFVALAVVFGCPIARRASFPISSLDL